MSLKAKHRHLQLRITHQTSAHLIAAYSSELPALYSRVKWNVLIGFCLILTITATVANLLCVTGLVPTCSAANND